jgi:hypothetical protein
LCEHKYLSIYTEKLIIHIFPWNSESKLEETAQRRLISRLLSWDNWHCVKVCNFLQPLGLLPVISTRFRQRFPDFQFNPLLSLDHMQETAQKTKNANAVSG